MNNQLMNICRSAFLLSFFLLFICTSSVYAAPSRVAILPFDIHAEKDLTFLQEGILDMLASRIAWQDNVEVIDENQTKEALAEIKGFEGESRALLVGGKLQADHVLFGSLTVFGESVSIDAQMVDVSGQQPALPFFAQTGSMGEVIPQINQFATNINKTVFNRYPDQQKTVVTTAPARTTVAPQAQPVPAPAPPQTYNPRMHPEKLLQAGVPSEAPLPAAGQPYQPTTSGPEAVAKTAAGSQPAGTYWRSKTFHSVITTLDIGDVDNDGAMEIVVAEGGDLIIYRNVNGRLAKIHECKDIPSGYYVGVDIGDINGNGTPEIFVSNLSRQRDRYNSFVLEFDGSAYPPIVDKSLWLYRINRMADGSTHLFGQLGPKDDENLFTQPVYQLNWENNDYIKGKRIIRSDAVNVMGMAYDDVLHNGQNWIVAFSKGDRIRILDAHGEEEFRGEEKLGGNMAYLNLPSKDTSDLYNIQYFPTRIRTFDINRDGLVEVVTAANKDIAQVIQRFRDYSNGRLQSVTWKGLKFAVNWKTDPVKGRISDFFIGDFDNDGTNELVAAFVQKEGRLSMAKNKSVIVSYDLQVSPPAE